VISSFSQENFRVWLKPYNRALALLIIAPIIAVCMTWVSTPGNVSNLWQNLQVKNQTYTELAFNNPNNLPAVIPANNIITFTFWVHNVEGRALVYPYTIIIKSGNTSTVIKKGEFYLGDNHQISIKENVTVPSTSRNNTVSTPAAPVASGATYTVVSGDTMWGIAQNNNIPLSQLEALNPQIKDPDLIFPSQSINLAGGTGSISGVGGSQSSQAAGSNNAGSSIASGRSASGGSGASGSQVEVTLTNLNQTIDFWLKGNN
jgi:LysM repeat protein